MPLSWIHDELDALKAAGLERRLVTWDRPGPWVEQGGRRLLNLASNDYLGLGVHPAVREAAARTARDEGVGAAASRLLAGSFRPHAELEDRLAAWKGHPSALLFSSGYLAALGVVGALVGRGDLILADRLSHACLLDAARLSEARLQRFAHNDTADLARLLAKRGEFRRCLIITESLFSMDGDTPPLADLLRLAARHDAALLVDEAHALGVLGPRGAGTTADLPEAATHLVALGTLGKSLASAGGFVTGPAPLRDLLIHRARAFIFDTAPTLPAVAAATAALGLLEQNPDWPATLRARSASFANALGLPAPAGPILPVVLGSNERALAVGAALREAGLLTGVVRPPTVPPGTARLRLSVRLDHDPADLARAAQAICTALEAAP